MSTATADCGLADWEKRPEPWRSIGLSYRAECRAIAAGLPCHSAHPAKRAYSRWTPQRLALLRELRSSGLTNPAIAEAMETSLAAIKRAVALAGLARR